MPAIGYSIGSSQENSTIKPLGNSLNESFTHFWAKSLPHNQQISAIQHNILADRHIQIIIWHNKIPQIQQLVYGAYSPLGQNPLNTCFPEHPENLSRGITSADTAAPAVHFHRQYLLLPYRKEPHGRTFTIRSLKSQVICNYLYILSLNIIRKITGKSARSSHNTIFSLGYLVI